MQIAALLTSHNRRTTTLLCLEALFAQALPPDAAITVYLADDGCTDGTAEEIRRRWPEVRLLTGDGTLYWCGGMRLAWRHALLSDYDCYLWLNDDTILFPGAIAALLATYRRVSTPWTPAVVVGNTCDPVTQAPTYGGYRRDMRSSRLMPPSGHPQRCDAMNGNIVLVPREVVRVVGILSAEFRHGAGDTDYGLRARRAGCTLWMAPGFQGACRRHAAPGWVDPVVPFRRRWRILHSPKGRPPREAMVFARRHQGAWWLMYLAKLYLRVAFPGTWQWLKQLQAGLH